MFEKKQSSLFATTSKKTQTNAFVNAGMKTSAETLSGNGAKKYSTTGNPCVDQFTFLGSYKQPRSFNDIAADCETLYGYNRIACILFIFYIRTITRVVTLFNGVSTKTSQKGAGLKHESIMRMIWLHMKEPKVFWDNIGLFVSLGSWHDIFTMLQYDLMYNGWNGRVLDWDQFGRLIMTGLENKQTVNLIKKYLPQIKAKSKCTTVESQADTMVAKWICAQLMGNKHDAAFTQEYAPRTYKQYRKLKSSGTAHQWQQLISQQKFERIDFAKIHGRALNLLVKGKFLTNHGLKDKYEKWVTKPETAVKYTGFVHEVMDMCTKYHSLVSMPLHERETVNKQFATLIEKGKASGQSSLIVVRDTSGSMGSIATGTNMSCYNIGKALALYFSYFLHGTFENTWIEFNSDAKMHSWAGNNPVERWFNDHSSYVGSTNFLSVIQLLCSIKTKGVNENDFPTGILCISDSEFNPTMLNQTNVETALEMLYHAGFSQEYINNFVIVLWNLRSSYYGRGTGKKFETYGNVQNVFYFSGYEASTISFLSGKIKNASELFEEAMNQEILNMIKL